jgi:hypothetical protein
MPARQERGERGGPDRRDLRAQLGERAPAQLAQHLRITAVLVAAARPQLAAHELVARLEQAEHRLDLRGGQPPARRGLGGGEWRMCARPARDQ